MCTVFLLHRLKSRCVEVNFQDPKVGPRTTEERQDRMCFEKDLNSGKFGKGLGWVVSLGKKLEERGMTDIDALVSKIQELPYFQDEPRKSQGWAILMYFTFEVCVHVC